MLALSGWFEALQNWIAGLGIRGIALFARIYVLGVLSSPSEGPLSIIAGLMYGA